MPRVARIKSNDSIYHVMVRSIKEVKLFQDDNDKLNYMNLIIEYQKTYYFKVYAYCLMDNHAHFIIDSNGADISKIMHSINFKYACSYNKKHDRYGHLFQDRFKSKVIENDSYLMTLSAYIHNNVISIKEYKNKPEAYRFSSLSAYLGYNEDPFGILDEAFVMQLFGEKVHEARKNYYNKVFSCKDKELLADVEFRDEGTLYKSERHILVRNFKHEDIFDFVAEKTGQDRAMLHIKNRRETINSRGLASFLMRMLCNYRCSDICKCLGNITQSRVSKLCSIGYKIIEEDSDYKGIVKEFIEKYAA